MNLNKHEKEYLRRTVQAYIAKDKKGVARLIEKFGKKARTDSISQRIKLAENLIEKIFRDCSND